MRVPPPPPPPLPHPIPATPRGHGPRLASGGRQTEFCKMTDGDGQRGGGLAREGTGKLPG